MLGECLKNGSSALSGEQLVWLLWEKAAMSDPDVEEGQEADTQQLSLVSSGCVCPLSLQISGCTRKKSKQSEH